MAATWAELIEDTRHHLRGLVPSTANQLNGSIGSADTSIVMEIDLTATGIGAGTVIEIDTELIRVGADGGLSATSCVRGWAGTTAAAHSDNAPVRVDPSTTGVEIVQAIDDVLTDMEARGIYRIDTETLTADADKTWFALTNTDIIEVRAVAGRDSTTDVSEPFASPRWRAFYDVDSAIAASGTVVQFERIFPATVGLEVTVGRVLPPVGTLTVSPVTDGLRADLHHVVASGAASRLLVGEEVARNMMAGQSSPRRAAEVPPGSLAAASDLLRRQYDRDLSRAKSRQDRHVQPQYPLRPGF